jgi:hypothetical protein
MKVAVLSESTADEAAIKVLLAKILHRETEEISLRYGPEDGRASFTFCLSQFRACITTPTPKA